MYAPAHSEADVVAVVASANSLPTIERLVGACPLDFPAALIVVHHFLGRRRFLPQYLRRRASLPVRFPGDGDPIEPGSVYIATGDQHLLVTAEKRFAVERTPPINCVRPAGDLLLTSIAAAFGARAIGVVLSGLGTDGARGIAALYASGAITLAQDPTTTFAPSMPNAAIATGGVHFLVGPETLMPALITLVTMRGAAGHFGLRQVA